MNENETISEEVETDEVIYENDIPSAADEAAALREELDRLRLELDQSRAFYGRMEAECAEFSELFPEVPLSSIPEPIWQSVKSGVPLAAAYALAARRESLRAQRAGEVNRENGLRSSGALNQDTYNDYFSPAEVKAMSPAEVRANYTKIINSMSKWH